MQIQTEIRQHPELAGGMLTLDESGDERSGPFSAGAARQMIGRLGKVEMGQVGVALGYYQRGLMSSWAMVAMVDARLYLPEKWFDQDHEKLRQRWYIPEETTFATKAQLGLEMIRQAKAKGMPFEILGCDATYATYGRDNGRDSEFRGELDNEGILLYFTWVIFLRTFTCIPKNSYWGFQLILLVSVVVHIPGCSGCFIR